MSKIVRFAIVLLGSMNCITAHSSSLEAIYSPTVVGVPPSDSYIGLSRLESGELRHYNYGEQNDDVIPHYLSSVDNGMTWKKVTHSPNLTYADLKSPISGEYIRIFEDGGKVYSLRTVGGLDGGRDIRVIDDSLAIMAKPPVFIRDGKRIIVGVHRVNRLGSFTYYSDDDGVTWRHSNLITVPLHTPNEYDKSYRWNHGAVEPTITELNDGRLWMIIRTSQDRHYQSFSNDGGETWSEATPSPFYGTISMPTLERMKDGRLLFFWCNTTPLPENEGNDGRWEDVFTNRNALHVAISEDDGESWIGMREIFLDECRNDDNYASKAGRDKSIHQVQCVELDDEKLLISFGQHKDHRKMAIFDVNWIYESSRSNSFENGLSDWTAFHYLTGIKGHCGYNREECDILRDHSDIQGAKMIVIDYQPNDKYVCDRKGAVWNFPAARSGSLTTRVKLPQGSESIKLILNDRWFNSSDIVSSYKSMYSVDLNRKELNIKDDKWHDIEIKWEHNKKASLYVDGKRKLSLPMINETEHGVSYLHFLGGTTPDEIGVSIDRVESQRFE